MILRQITIPGEVISKKNSPLVIRLGRRYSIKPSNRYTEYEKEAVAHFKKHPCEPLDVDYLILMHFFFYKLTVRSFDYNNMSQGPQDILAKVGVIPDDSNRYVKPVFHSEFAGWEKDKDHPRVVITITNLNHGQ